MRPRNDPAKTRDRSSVILLVSILGIVALIGPIARADEKPPTLSLSRPDVSERPLAPERPKAGSSRTESTGGWWITPVGLAAALAVFGGLSLASKRFLPNRESGPIQVVGRSSLSPKHSVYLLRVGERVLIVGTGPQGAPATLGEVTDPAELARLAPRKTGPPGLASVAPIRVSPASKTTGFDRRIGDDE
jgi:flagellar biogenesis protein FliO